VKAEKLLRVRQQQRFLRWQRLKMEVCKTGFDACNDAPKDKLSQQWDEKTREVINSLNSFMCMVNEVKRPVQR
jgi:hypothetical protein